MQYLESLPLNDLIDYLKPAGESKAKLRAFQIYQWTYVRGVTEWDQMTDLAKDFRLWLKENLAIYEPRLATEQRSEDGTTKILWELSDKRTIESVIIPIEKSARPLKAFAGAPTDKQVKDGEFDRLTACISSQVGCAMACGFCLTGTQGLTRHLETHEIVGQIRALRARAPINNIVFMGMGEPLHNVDNVIRACKILTEPLGLKFSKRKVTVSTSGLVPAIERLGKEADVQLAVSLNATTDEVRSEIMPVNRRWPIADLLAACKRYPTAPHRWVTIEYVLLKGINDSLQDAARLVKLLRGLNCKVNLIPFNAHEGTGFERPDDSVVREFKNYLLEHHLTATVRVSRGRDISAACGQLKSAWGQRAKTQLSPISG